VEHRQEPKTDKNLGVHRKLEQLDRRESQWALSDVLPIHLIFLDTWSLLIWFRLDSE
jgi:hypothetical protein